MLHRTFHKYIRTNVTVNKHCSSEIFEPSFASTSSFAKFGIFQISSAQLPHYHTDHMVSFQTHNHNILPLYHTKKTNTESTNVYINIQNPYIQPRYLHPHNTTPFKYSQSFMISIHILLVSPHQSVIGRLYICLK